MLYGITGDLGEGKTLALVYLLYQQYKKGHPIHANFHLFHPFKKFNYVATLDDIGEIKGGYFGADELWSWIDSRDWKVPKRKKVDRIILYSRKRGCDIIYTTQRLGQIEKRIRENTSIIIQPVLEKFVKQAVAKRLAEKMGYDTSMLHFEKDKDVALKCRLEFRTISPREEGKTGYSIGSVFQIKKFFTLPYWFMYDTREEIRLEE